MAKTTYTPFRTKLIYFASAVIGFVALIVIPVELYRPIARLHELIKNASSSLAGVEAAFDPARLQRMNRFALATTERLYQLDADGEPVFEEIDAYYLALAFNLILMEEEIPPEDIITERLEFLYVFEEAGGFDYGQLLQAAWFWDGRFSTQPALLPMFREYKQVLVEAKANTREAGIDLRALFVMIDPGEKAGDFENAIAYLLDSVPWWADSPSSTGELYEFEGNEFWRASALAGREEFDHNPIHDPDNFFLPRFDQDEFGTWFSVWLTRETGQLYNIFNIDFNAASVQRTLLIVATAVVVTILALIVLVYFIAAWLSRMVTRPITELTNGAEAVRKGNYDYEVPVLKEDEFGELTRQFNEMTRGQKERLNLMDTMEKFLSKELAEMAAKQGLQLGGMSATCTVMFTDFAGFSTITQKMSARDTVEALNTYYDGLIPIIKRYGGFTDKYIGDAIVALFGAPVKVDDHAERAVACAIEMQWKIREINEERRQKDLTVFEMRVGLNTGEVIVGAIGCDAKLEYTSIGETTNLANRMEAICKLGHVMLAEGTYHAVSRVFFWGVNIAETPTQLKVKGYPKPVATYGVYVDDLLIEKNNDPEASIDRFYLYEKGEHTLFYQPEDVANASFERESKYLNQQTVLTRRMQRAEPVVS